MYHLVVGMLTGVTVEPDAAKHFHRKIYNHNKQNQGRKPLSIHGHDGKYRNHYNFL